MKLYEYLAAGRPVVATDLEELRNMSAPVSFATGPEEFATAIKHEIERGPDRPEFYQFARENDWDNRRRVVREHIARCLQ